MVSNDINLPVYGNVECDYFKLADTFVDDLISTHSQNAEMMNLMALEATSLVTSVESRSREIESQNIIIRFWNETKGKNQKIGARNDLDLASSQYLGQQILNKLSENNLITYQMVVALGNKVKRVVDDVNDTRREIAELNQTLATFFSGLRENLEQKFTSLKRNNDLLFWKETIMFDPVYKGKEYSQLERPEKIICLANDFYCRSHQEWDQRDLAFLKSIIVEVGNHPDEKVVLKEIYQSYQENNEILNQLLKGVDGVTSLSDANEITPTLMAFNKLKSLNNEESHIVDTVVQFAPDSPKNEVSLELTSKLVLNQTSQDLNREISMFDAVMNLVEDLSFYKTLSKAKFDADALLISSTVKQDVHEDLKKEFELLKSKHSMLTKENSSGVNFDTIQKSSIKIIKFEPSNYNEFNNVILPKGTKGIILGGVSNSLFSNNEKRDYRLETEGKHFEINSLDEDVNCISSERFSTSASFYISHVLPKYLCGSPIYFDGLKIVSEKFEANYESVSLIIMDINNEIALTGESNSDFSISHFSKDEMFKVS